LLYIAAHRRRPAPRRRSCLQDSLATTMRPRTRAPFGTRDLPRMQTYVTSATRR
jgi:hypothetical protein